MLSRREAPLGASTVTVGLSLPMHESQSARAAGFWYPEETEPHKRTFMQWPARFEIQT